MPEERDFAWYQRFPPGIAWAGPPDWKRELSEHVPHSKMPQSWDLACGDCEDMVTALAALLGGRMAIVDGRYAAWIPPEPPPAPLVDLLRSLRGD